MIPVPLVDRRLEPVALDQQGPVPRGEVMHEVGEAGPERVGLHTRAGQHVIGDELVEIRVNGQAVDRASLFHLVMPGQMEESASERAYRWTRTRILDGTLAGGDMISEGEVSELVGVSRTPVREAFVKLSTEGRLRLFPKRGAVVVALTEADSQDMIEARLLIEPWAVAEAARLPTREKLGATLSARIEELVAASRDGDVVAYQEADRAFHEAILEATGNRLLAEFYRTLRDRQLRVGAAVVATTAGRAGTIVDEHREIASAIAGGDAQRASNAVRAHIETTRQALRRRTGVV